MTQSHATSPALIDQLQSAHAALSTLTQKARAHVNNLVTNGSFDTHQHTAHGLSWLATYRDTFAALGYYAAHHASPLEVGTGRSRGW